MKGRTAAPAALPDVFGPGAVLTVGNVVMKVTNFGTIGNAFVTSSDPSGQWPGASGVEYLFAMFLGVGGVNPNATDPTAMRRMSYIPEWNPPTPDPEDRMYRAYDGIISGNRLVNDDGDFNPFTGEPSIDEDFLDGRDNDGDSRIDEDYGALGQQMFSCVMRDDTPAAFAASTAEAHVPLVTEVRQLAWAYSVPGFMDFNVIQWDVYNRSGHSLDSLYFGGLVDMDAGPTPISTYFSDDRDIPYFPSGEFRRTVGPDDPRFQSVTLPGGARDTLCPVQAIRINGFSLVDDNGDEGRTPGVVSLLLFGHTLDPLGIRAPARVGFRAFRSYVQGTPYLSNGGPTIDQQRFEFLSSRQNIDPATGFLSAPPGDQPGDYRAWFSVGPFLDIPDGGMFSATLGIAVNRGRFVDLQDYPLDYASYQAGLKSESDLFEKYPSLETAFTAQIAYEGVYEPPLPGFEAQVPDCHGCETGVKLPAGSTPTVITEVCPDREAVSKQVTDNAYTWFDLDCDPCTGAWNEASGQGYYLRHWNAESPPPSPNLNVAASHNYSDNPDRVRPAGDNQVTLAWDNVAETTADPKVKKFDFRSYRIWKVAGWRRPVGAAGPNDEDWALLAEYRLFDYADSNSTRDPNADTLVCPMVFVPSHDYPPGHPHCSDPLADPLELRGGGCRDTATVKICLRNGDFWDRQTGVILRPEAVDCVRGPGGECLQDSGWALEVQDISRVPPIKKSRYPVGRYLYLDREVKNGFVYFYSVTAGDSSSGGELYGRRTAVEADQVAPQGSTKSGKSVWVVPNPYRGFTSIDARPSAWDLTPNATDPTGTHIDFMGLPQGKWRIRIYTVSGDLVAELHEDDAVNPSIRNPVTGPDNVTRPGYNRQQDSPDDGQARWDLISRNGQDVVSGIYVFVVDSNEGVQRGRFVVIR
ncbi:MAG TPA: hypothetical protein VFQ05_06925 [Candidatus Eisenbacteria bacterium]|nr:hypothetical protein [Candidatus Eisenbacteria bacterium]